MASASSSSRTGMIGATGPNTSSVATAESRGTSVSTVGG